MKKKKNIIIILIIILILVGVGLALANKFKTQPTYITYTVKKENLQQTVEATGKTEAAEKINLSFKISGRLNNIKVQEGDQVKAGQILARLEANNLASSVANAQAQVDQAISDYQKLLAGASAEDIRVSEYVASQKQQNLIAAQDNLKNLKNKRDTELLNLKETAVNYLNNEIVTAQNAVNEIDNTLTDSDAKNTLSILDSSQLSLAQNSQTTAQQSINQTKLIIASTNGLSEDTALLNALNELKNTLDLVAASLDDTTKVLNATLTSDNLSESELDTLKSNISSQQTKINTSKINIQTAKSNWTNKKAYYQDQTVVYENNVLSAQKELAIANSQLVLKKTPPRQFEINAAQAKIKQARANLKLAQANLDQTIIKAPISGTITKKDFELGEQVPATATVLEMIGQSNLQIEVDVPESDIVKLKIGQDAQITLDAFGDDKMFTGKIIFIDPAETIIQDVVYYKVKVELDDSTKQTKYNIKPGMTSNLTFLIKQKNNILAVPTRAIKSDSQGNYVEILNNHLPQKRKIQIGLRGNQQTEIISGLNEGEQVITFTKK